jgi:cytochrome c556
MMRVVLAAVTLAFGVTAVVAQGDVIAERKSLMKRSGEQARAGSQMVRGEAPYDQAKAQAIFDTFIDKAQKLPALFPATSRTGDTRALPAIWEKPNDFKAAVDKFGADARKAKADTKDLDSFKTAFAAVGRNCGSCHEAFRRPQ